MLFIVCRRLSFSGILGIALNMATKSKKSKVVNKDDLRKLMKEHKSSAASNKKRITSPLAK